MKSLAINKLTFDLSPAQYTEEDRKQYRQLRTELPAAKTSWMKKLLTVAAVAEAARARS
jgi:hypothetical protein